MGNITSRGRFTRLMPSPFQSTQSWSNQSASFTASTTKPIKSVQIRPGSALLQQVLDFQPITSFDPTTPLDASDPTELIKFLQSSCQTLTFNHWADLITRQCLKVLTSHHSQLRQQLIRTVRAAMVVAPLDYLLHPSVTDPAVLVLFKKLWYDNTCYVLWSREVNRITSLYQDLHGGETILLSWLALPSASQKTFWPYRSIIQEWLSQTRDGLIGPLGSSGCIADSQADPTKVYPLLKRLGIFDRAPLQPNSLKLFLDLLGLSYQADDLIEASFFDSGKVSLDLLRLLDETRITIQPDSNFYQLLRYLLQCQLVTISDWSAQRYHDLTYNQLQDATITWYLEHKIPIDDSTLAIMVNQTQSQRLREWLNRLIQDGIITADQIQTVVTKRL